LPKFFLKIVSEGLLTIMLWAVFACFGFSPVFAAEDGVYLTATHTYYLNPDTGVTDDGGTKNIALGEGMCRSVVYEKALVEIDGGRIYVTVRLQLMSNMRDFRLFIQDAPGGSYTKTSPRVTAEDAGADTADYRFELPSAGAYVSWEMYVIPMGRDVKFYMNLSESLSEGSSDFVVSVKPKAAENGPAASQAQTQSAPAGSPPASQTNENDDAGSASESQSPNITESTAAPSAPSATEPPASPENSPATEASPPEETPPASEIPEAQATPEAEAALAVSPPQTTAPGANAATDGAGEQTPSGGISPVLILAAAFLILAGIGAVAWLPKKRRQRT
jgi:hypothetical protein